MSKYKTFDEMFNDDKIVMPELREEVNFETALIGEMIDTRDTEMEYKGYHAKINYDVDDEIFVGEVLEINDSLNFHGAIDDYLDLCLQKGIKPENPS